MKKFLLILTLTLPSINVFAQALGQEVLSYSNGCANPLTENSGVVIKTKYPYSSARYMPTVIIEGQNFGTNQTIGLIISWYVYSSGIGQDEYFYSKTISSYGGYAPDVYLYNDGGFVSIFLRKGIESQYCISFKVRSWLRIPNDSGADASWYTNWSAVTIDATPNQINDNSKMTYNNTIGNATVIGSRPIKLNSALGSVNIKANTGGWAMNYGFLGSNNTDMGGLWGYGANDALDQWSIGKAYTDKLFVVKNSGKVGIGTDAPDAKLEIYGNTSGGSNFRATGNNARLVVDYNGLGQNYYDAGFHIFRDFTGSEKMRLDGNSGRVGIGTSNPNSKLEVKEGKIIAGTRTAVNGATVLESQYEQGGANGSLSILGTNTSSGGWAMGYGVHPKANEYDKFTSSTPLSLGRSAIMVESDVRFMTASEQSVPIGNGITLTEKMKIANNGNVGIGTTNPTQKLTIANNNATVFRLESIDNPTAYYTELINNYNGANRFSINVGGDYILGHKVIRNDEQAHTYLSGRYGIGFATEVGVPSAIGDGVKMFIAPNGYVGMGTLTPTNTLTIDSKSNAKSGLTFTGLSKKLDGTSFAPDLLRSLGVNSSGEVVVIDGTVGTGDIWTKSGDNVYRNAGNVGIGTTTPTEKLEINGTAKINTQLYVGDKFSSYTPFNVSQNGGYPYSAIFAHSDPTIDRRLVVGQFGDQKVMGLQASTHTTGNLTNLSLNPGGGNIGIGTTTPKAKLDINGDIVTSTTQSEDLHSVAERTTRYIGHKSGITGDGFTGMKLNVSQSPKCGNRSSIAFQTWGCGVSVSRDVMVIDEEGGVTMGVGINNSGTHPIAPLHVVGGINSGIRLSGGSARFTITDNITNLWNIDNAGGTLRFFREDYNANSFGPNGSVSMVISKTGNVGIGTDNPSSQLQVAGSFNLNGVLKNNGYGISVEGASAGLFFYGESDAKNRQYGLYHVRSSEETILRANNNDNAFVLNKEGNIRIGTATMPAGYKLAVGGDVIAERVVVKLQTNWPDYVFKTGYSLRPLSEVEAFVKTNNHLPDVPSEAEIKEKGIDMEQMNATLLKKVEELTLYLIEMKKQNETLLKRVENLEKK
ncbi:MAG: hypothetical protein MUF58_02245 [Arcicella sp.]|jgi:hypothetical protein|nr:hypothetical protein [Arcicella sp.]